MPCEQCEEGGKYRWGENGECMYETLEDCQLDNQGEYLEEQIKPAYDKPVDFTMHFTKEQMEKLHGEGEVLIEVEGNEEGETMNILFTYDKEEREEEKGKGWFVLPLLLVKFIIIYHYCTERGRERL